MTTVAISEAATAWETARDFAQSKGWSVELTPRGRTICRKAGSVVFGPGHGSSVAAYRDLIDRLGYVDGFMSACRSRRP
jgi:hypothetical protein